MIGERKSAPQTANDAPSPGTEGACSFDGATMMIGNICSAVDTYANCLDFIRLLLLPEDQFQREIRRRWREEGVEAVGK